MSDSVISALFVWLGYLCGSISFSYWLGRRRDAMDLRRKGSGKLSASNVYNYYGVWGLVLVGLVDVLKAAVPVWLARQAGQSLEICALTGLAAMAGHNWSLYLNFRGGRGVSAALGTLLNLFPAGVPWLLGHLAAGRLVPRQAAAVGLLGIVTLPLLAQFLNQPRAVILCCWGILLLTVLKRLEGSHKEMADRGPRWRVLLCRLLLDRDIPDFDAWISDDPQLEGHAG